MTVECVKWQRHKGTIKLHNKLIQIYGGENDKKYFLNKFTYNLVNRRREESPRNWETWLFCKYKCVRNGTRSKFSIAWMQLSYKYSTFRFPQRSMDSSYKRSKNANTQRVRKIGTLIVNPFQREKEREAHDMTDSLFVHWKVGNSV